MSSVANVRRHPDIFRPDCEGCRAGDIQPRHNAATRFRAEFGIEAAMDMLGHANMNTAAIYAERDEAQMAERARKVG